MCTSSKDGGRRLLDAIHAHDRQPNYIGKLLFLESPAGTYGSGEYIIVEQTGTYLYGVHLGSSYDAKEVRQIPRVGDDAWYVIRVSEGKQIRQLIKTTMNSILAFSQMLILKRIDYEEAYEQAEYVAGVLARLCDRLDKRECLSSWSLLLLG